MAGLVKMTQPQRPRPKVDASPLDLVAKPLLARAVAIPRFFFQPFLDPAQPLEPRKAEAFLATDKGANGLEKA